MWDAREIEAAMSRRRFALRLDPALEAEYDRRAEPGSRRQIVSALLCLLALTIAGLPADANAGILPVALLLKLGLHVPALLVGLWAVWFLPIPPRLLWLTGAVPLAVTVAVVTIMALAADPPATDRFATVAGISVFAANVALPMKFRPALVLTLVNVALFVGIPVLFEPADLLAGYFDVLLFMSAIGLATTILVHSRERAQKLTFLLALTNERQTAELQGLVDELTQLAHRDPLTGVGNRRSFDMRFETAWRSAALRRDPMVLVLIDVDHFKLYNDTAGHAAGDACLKAVAGAIAEGAHCPPEMVSRYGGEEFALILPVGGAQAAEAVRASVEALAHPHPGLPAGSIVTVSVGKALATPGTSGSSPEALMRDADEALYEAKRTGRNRVAARGHVRAAA